MMGFWTVRVGVVALCIPARPYRSALIHRCIGLRLEERICTPPATPLHFFGLAT